MIKNVKCIGLKRGVSKKNGNKPFTTLYFDVTNEVLKNNDSVVGNIVSSHFVWEKLPDNIVGTDIVCSIDDFGNINDCEI